MTNEFFSTTLLEKKELARDTYVFTFSTKGLDFAFLPGQFTTLLLENETRDFSIASSPAEKDILQIVTKKGVSDFKNRLVELEVGNAIQLTRPTGGFILENNDIAQVFIAGGVGITPFYSMLKYAQDKKMERPMTLFASFSRVEDIIFYDELQEVQNTLKNKNVVYTISSPISGWHGEKGRIHQDLLRKYISDILAPVYYIVGKVEMVDDMYDMLLEMEIPQEKIKIEYFTGY